MSNARIVDSDTLRGLQMDPSRVDKEKGRKVNEPPRLPNFLFDAILRLERKNDREYYINRFQWHNLPDGIKGEDIERILYYRYSGIFFYSKTLNKFLFTPWTPTGTIDYLGRYPFAKPLPFLGSSEAKANDRIMNLPEDIKTVSYDMFDDVKPEDCAIVLQAYTRGMTGQASELREAEMMEPVLQAMAEAFPLARTNAFINAGTKGMRVNNPDEYSNVLAANASLDRAALNGERFVPIVGQQDFQDFGDKGNADGEDFFKYYEALNNYRLKSYGIRNNGLYEKEQYVNNTMTGNITNNVGQILQDALKLHQDFCDHVNAKFGLGIACTASETITNTDSNMDGEILDDNPTQQIGPDEAQGVQSNE